MPYPLERVILLTGHYGSGKTNLAVNLALDFKNSGKDVVVCDLDIVNPYFRSADFAALMERRGIQTIVPEYAGSNLDLPSIGAGLSAAVRQKEKTVIVDVGGDDAGAVALGRYANDFKEIPYSLVFVYNYYRLMTREPAGALEILNDIRAVTRLTPCGILNNSNLCGETTEQTLLESLAPCRELARLSGLPILFSAAPRQLADELPPNDFYPVDIYVKQPWQA